MGKKKKKQQVFICERPANAKHREIDRRGVLKGEALREELASLRKLRALRG